MSQFFGNAPWDGGGGGGGGTPVIIIDNLNSTSATSALSANQGRELKAYIDGFEERLIEIESTPIIDASLTEKGITKLNDAIDSDSTTESATPNAVKKALEEAKRYSDEIEEKLSKNTYLKKYEFVVPVSSVGQTVFEIPFDKYIPEEYEEFIFVNTTKVPSNLYTIELGTSGKYNLILSAPLNNTSSIVNIVLLTEEDEDGNVSKSISKNEFILTMSEEGQTELIIPFADYSPEKYIDFLFFNTTKILPNQYTISKVDESSSTSSYKIVLATSPTSWENATYNLVLLSNGNARSEDSSVEAINKSSIIFGIRGSVTNGRKDEEFFPVPYDIKVVGAIATVVTPSSVDMRLNIQNTKNFTDYSNILPTDILIPSGTNSTSLNIGYDLLLSRGDNLFINIGDYAEDASNLVINLIIEKI